MVISMNIILREAKDNDMPLLEKLTLETGWKTIPETQRMLLDREKWNKYLVEVFENLSKRKNSEIFIAEDEKHEFIGYVFVGESGEMITGLSSGFIYDIFVEEKFRGKGIGKLLLEKAEDYCRRKGYSRIALMVSAANDSAIRLYTRTGFKPEQMYMAKELI
jgi:ribosomal protein S18 acetylase RimI-like enzyme